MNQVLCLFLMLGMTACLPSEINDLNQQDRNQTAQLNNYLSVEVEGAVVMDYKESSHRHYSVILKPQSLDFRVDVVHQGCETYYVNFILQQKFEFFQGYWQLFSENPDRFTQNTTTQSLGVAWSDQQNIQALSLMHTFEPLKQQDENQFSWWVKVNQTQEWVGVAKTLSEFQTNIESANTESNYTCVSIHDSKDVYDGTQKKYIMRQRISVASPGVNIQFAMTHSIWINYESIDSFIDKMNQESIEFLVIIGNDFIPKNAIENKNLMTHLNRLKMPYFVSNAHPKIQGRNKTYWKNILGDNNFAFDHKTVRFVFIDSSEHSLQQFQYNLLETWSQRTPLIWSFQPQIRSRFLFTRNAFLSHGDQIGDDLVFDHQMEGVRILNLLNRYDFEAIFSSNESFLKLEEKNSIRHILVPPLFDPKQADPLQWIKVQIQIDCNRPSITECMKTDLHRGVLDHSQ